MIKKKLFGYVMTGVLSAGVIGGIGTQGKMKQKLKHKTFSIMRK